MKLECPECKSKNIMYTKKNNSYWCRRCGKVFPKEIKKEGIK